MSRSMLVAHSHADSTVSASAPVGALHEPPGLHHPTHEGAEMTITRCTTCNGEIEEVGANVGTPVHVDAGEAANCADIRGDQPIETYEVAETEQTILLSISLRAPRGFDVEKVDDHDLEQTASLADHLAGYIGAALDGLYDGQERSLGLKHVALVDVIDGDA